MRSRIFSKVNPSDPAKLVTTVTIPDQLSGKDNSSSKVWTSSLNLMPTDISLAKIEFVLLMCSVTEIANPQFAFSTNWNLYHRIFNSELSFFCHLKWLNEILGTTNFRSWQSLFFKIKTTKIAPPKITHQQTWSQSPLHWRSAALDRSCQDAHHRCSRSAPPLSLVTAVTLHFVPSQTSTPTEHTCNPNFGCRCRLCETLALGCRCNPCKTLALGCSCRLCETLALGRYCSRNFHVSLINFCWSDLWCVNEPSSWYHLMGKNARGSNTHNHESTAKKNKQHKI